MAVGHKFNQQMAHMLVFHSCLHMIMWATQCAPTYTSVHVHTVRREHAHMAPQNHREREKLNHIISSQIINDIIFSCSSYNIGLLDAGGNEEGVRLREGGGREREQRKLQKNRACVVDERIQSTTKRTVEKSVETLKEGDCVNVCSSETGCCEFGFAQIFGRRGGWEHNTNCILLSNESLTRRKVQTSAVSLHLSSRRMLMLQQWLPCYATFLAY